MITVRAAPSAAEGISLVQHERRDRHRLTHLCTSDVLVYKQNQSSVISLAAHTFSAFLISALQRSCSGRAYSTTRNTT